jgi:RNA polymerase sigma-70 factor (ECF subfamily)
MKMAVPDIFTSLIDMHKGIIYKIANVYCRDDEQRKDLVQEILLQLWRSFGNYDAQYRHSTWIYRVSLNVAISFYRKEQTRKKIAQSYPEEIFQLKAEEKKPEVREEARLLLQCIDELPALDRALILLYLEGKSHKEMAEIMGISETNVATKVSRIKNRLKQRFSK